MGLLFTELMSICMSAWFLTLWDNQNQKEKRRNTHAPVHPGGVKKWRMECLCRRTIGRVREREREREIRAVGVCTAHGRICQKSNSFERVQTARLDGFLLVFFFFFFFLGWMMGAGPVYSFSLSRSIWKGCYFFLPFNPTWENGRKLGCAVK